jgi:hypothetical protein
VGLVLEIILVDEWSKDLIPGRLSQERGQKVVVVRGHISCNVFSAEGKVTV